MIPNLKLRVATIDDLKTLQHWDEQPHVIACDPDDEWDWEYELQYFPDWREQLVAELDGRPIGFLQIIDPYEEESHYWGEVDKNLRAIDIWIGEADDLGKGYGREMMRLALDRCFKDENVTAVIIDPLQSNKVAIRFYEKMGFQFVEERNFEGSQCAIYRISREEWEDAQG